MSLQSDVNELVRKLNKVANNAKRESQSAFREGAKPLVEAIKAGAPVSDEEHYRYLGGKVVATYTPGNLKRSIRTMTFRRSGAVFVGPKFSSSSGSKGVFSGNRTDPWYAHIMELEYGLSGKRPQPFIRPAAASTGPTALRIATVSLKRKIDAYANRLGK